MTLLNELIGYCRERIIDNTTTCLKHKWACQRFLRDIDNQNTVNFPYYFDEKKAEQFFSWVRLFKHRKGPLQGRYIEPAPVQKFIFGNIYGWIHQVTGFRRFNKFYWQVARKNAKSQSLALVGTYETMVYLSKNGETSEVYCAAPLALDTPILTVGGWKTIGTIQKGDKVFDENGEQACVNYLSPIVNRDTYKLIFDDGSVIRTTDNHLWEVERFQYKNKKMERVRITASTLNILNNLKYSATVANRIKIAEPLNFSDKNLLIDPYTLGVWLGDGRANRGHFFKDIKDHEIMDRIINNGYILSTNKGDRTYYHTVLGLRKYLRAYNLINNKHIPREYFEAGIEQRLELLRGLMDTDGTCTKTGECRFGASNIQLGRDFHELAIGLGIKAHFNIVKDCNNKDVSIIRFKCYSDRKVFHLKRKADRQINKNLAVQCSYRYIRSIKKIPSVSCRCIEVLSKSHLFLVGKSLITTHNTKREQAKIVYDESVAMLEGCPSLRDRYKVAYGKIQHIKTGSIMRPLSEEDRKTGDGLNPQCGIIDEYHAHETPEIYDIIESGMGARQQPLLGIISTAGFELSYPCYQVEYNLVSKILNPNIDFTLDNYFALICELDKNETAEDVMIGKRKVSPGELLDDITDENSWKKANPIICSYPEGMDYLRKKHKEATEAPEKMRNFFTKHLDVWVSMRESGYMNMERWALCKGDFPDLKKKICFCGIDLSAKLDLTSVGFEFLIDDKYYLLSHSFIPEETLEQKRKTDRVPYDLWVREGWITLTPGAVIDYRSIRDYIIREVREKGWVIQEICVDPWGAAQISSDLIDEGHTVVEIIQGIKTLSEPTKNFREMVYQKRIIHDGNPVLTWAVSNAIVEEVDRNKNIILNKKKSKQRIDPVAALINAHVRAMVTPLVSVYNERGLRSLV